MGKLFVSVCCALALLAAATVSDAVVNPRIYVKITDGTVAGTVDGLVTPTKLGLVLAKVSNAPAGTLDATDTLNVLTCQVRPCSVFFPSGTVGATGLGTDTFRIQDVSSTSLARVEKFDSGASADRVSFKGVKITSTAAGAGKVLTVTYGVESGALRALPAPVPPATSTSYTGTVALTGTFKNSTGTARATACNLGLTATDVADSCVRLSLALNGTIVNGAGGTAVATVAVPCNNSTTGSPSPASVNPCGVNGIYTSSLGSFTGINDSKSINCPTSCSPTQVGTIVAEFNGTGEVLQLTASANGGMANVSDEVGGLEEVFLTLADELGANRWVAYSATIEKCKAVPKAPTVNDTRNINNNSNVPISFEYWCGFFAPPTPPGAGIDLVSIVDSLEDNLAGSAATRNDAARVAFLPAQGQLLLKNITVLSLTYDVVVGLNLPSGNNTLGNLDFADCAAGSFRVELELLNNQGAPVGIAKVYLGSNAGDQFKSVCSDFLSGFDLASNTDARVDTSGLAGNLGSPTPITFQQLKSGNTGQLRVRKMSVIVDHGDVPLTESANHKVTFKEGNVNGFLASPFLQVVTTPTRTFDLSTNGVSIVIKKLTDGNGNPVDEVVKVIRSADIQIIGGKFSASVNVNEISPESGAQYTISLCPNGAEETLPLTDTTTPLGLCIPDQAFMTLL
jgi:hypothetical protein